jgi:hypothetical protein
MVLLARALQQALVGGLLDEGMLEQVGRLRRDATLVEQFGFDEPCQSLLQRRLVQGRHGLQQLIREGAPQTSPQLGHGFDRSQAIQPGHKGVVQRGGNGQRGQGACQLIVRVRFPQQARFQHRLGHHVLEHGWGQGFSPRSPAQSSSPPGAGADAAAPWG